MNPVESARIRARILAWESAQTELAAMKGDVLMALSEEESARWFDGMDLPLSEIWRAPSRMDGSGLVEQQRLFSKLHGKSA